MNRGQKTRKHGVPPHLYFAYGSNMDTKQMRSRCPSAYLRGSARLIGYRFLVNRRGVATVVESALREVHGVLWEIDRNNERELDRYEGVARGHYSKRESEAYTLLGEGAKVFFYIATDSTQGSPRPGYMERIILAAEQHQLPHEYIRELKTWLKTRD